MTATQPTIGRIVIFRSRTGNYDVPAIVTATEDTLNPAGVRAFEESGGERGVPPLSGNHCVHLTVFTPGLPGQRASAEDFLEQPKHGISENLAGCYQEWDVSMASEEYDGEIQPGSWRWPTRAPAPDPGLAQAKQTADELVAAPSLSDAELATVIQQKGCDPLSQALRLAGYDTPPWHRELGAPGPPPDANLRREYLAEHRQRLLALHDEARRRGAEPVKDGMFRVDLQDPATPDDLWLIVQTLGRVVFALDPARRGGVA